MLVPGPPAGGRWAAVGARATLPHLPLFLHQGGVAAGMGAGTEGLGRDTAVGAVRAALHHAIRSLSARQR